MSLGQPALILASASPRRSEILSTLGLAFEVQPSLVDESSLRIDDDVEFVREAALAKLGSVLERTKEGAAYVLAADTIVCVGERRLGKPADDADAVAMLRLLSGRDHVVRTAIALGQVGRGALGTRVVELHPVTLAQNARLEGSYTNVVGLPAAEVVALLLEHGALERWP